MVSRSVHRTRVPDDARGIALVVVLLVMGLVTLLGVSFLTIASTERTIASNEVGVAKAFNIAEAGFERVKARMKTGTETNLDAFLTGTSPGPYPFGSTPAAGNAFDGGNFIVRIYDNNDEVFPTPNNLNDDIDKLVFIESKGMSGNTQKMVVALAEVVLGAGPVPGGRGAAESLTNGGNVEIHGEPGAFDGRNWTLPPLSDMASCGAASTCGTLPDPNAAVTYGAFSNKSGASFSLSGGGTMFGTGCLPPSACTSAATASNTVDTTSPYTRWDSFINAAIAAADRTVGEAVVGGAAGTLTWGTAANPEVTVMTDSGTGSISWAKTVNGAGVLIIESTSTDTGTAFAASGQLNWQGLVIFRAPGTIQFDSTNGKVRIFGELVVIAGGTGRAEIELKGPSGSFVKYSSAALSMAQQASTTTFTLKSWREAAMQ